MALLFTAFIHLTRTTYWRVRVSQSTGLDYSLPVIGSVPVRIEVDAHWLRQTGAEPGIFSQKLVPV